VWSDPSTPGPEIPNRRKAARRLNDRRLLQRERELEAARRMTQALFQRMNTDDLVQQALQTTLEVIGAQSGSVLLAVPEKQVLVFRHSIGLKPVQPGTAIPWDQGIAGAVFRSGEPMVVGEAKRDERHYTGIDALTGQVTHDMIAVPLKRWEGEPIGVLEVLNKRHGLLGKDDLAILSIVSAIAATSIEQARLFQEAKLAEVVRILGDISHDIKNLLMPVVCGAGLLHTELNELFASLVEREMDKARASRELCDEVISMLRTSTRRIQDRVREIADCVKGLSTPPQFGPCRVGAVVASVFQTLRLPAEEKGVSLRSEGLEGLPEILADERRLFNAFYNLVSNAIPEMLAGGSITVSGKEQPAANGITVSVADTGRGMPPEVRESLFTTRAKSTKAGGTGLGTKIVKDVMDAHGGTVTVDSTIGVGTTFCLHFPLRPPAALAARSATSTPFPSSR
jgi:signal transduction histidine kinase